MIHPLVQQFVQGTVIYGIIMLYCAGFFQVWRKEKKSATVLLCAATVILALTILLPLLRIPG
jgi:uncharacterized membrane protein